MSSKLHLEVYHYTSKWWRRMGNAYKVMAEPKTLDKNFYLRSLGRTCR